MKTHVLRYVLLLALLAGTLRGVEAADCASDAGCFFGETWEAATTLCDINGGTWSCSGFLQNPANAPIVSPGLNGTNKAVRLMYGNDTNGDANSGGWADGNRGDISHTSPNGEVFFVEWWTKFSPGFVFGVNGQGGPPPGNNFPSFKHFEWNGDSATGCQNRILLTFEGDAASGWTTAVPLWYIGPNFGEVAECTTANLTAPGSQNSGGFIYPSGIGSTFRIQRDVLYHMVTEFKSHNNQQGYVKTWANGTLILQATNMTTCANVGGTCTWKVMRFGGQFGKTVAGSYADWDQIRATTSVISPSSGSEYWVEDFERATLGSHWVGSLPDVMPYISTTMPHTGTRSLQLDYTGSIGGGYTERTIPPTPEVWTRWWRRTHAFTYEPTTGTKAVLLSPLAYAGPQFWSENGNGSRELSIYVQYPAYDCGHGLYDSCQIQPNIASVPLPDDQWYCVEIHLKMNDPGVPNGVAEIWIDNRQTMNRTDLTFRGPNATNGPGGVNGGNAQFEFTRMYRQAGIGTMWYDDYAIGPVRIGCELASPALSDPSNLKLGKGTATPAMGLPLELMVGGLLWFLRSRAKRYRTNQRTREE